MEDEKTMIDESHTASPAASQNTESPTFSLTANNNNETRKSSKKSTHEMHNNSTTKPSNTSTSKSSSGYRSSTKSSDKSSNRSSAKSSNRSSTKSSNRSSIKSSNQSLNRSSIKSSNRSSTKSSNASTTKSSNRSTIKKWDIMADEIESLYAEANKVLSNGIGTFSKTDQLHPYLNMNHLDLFGDAVVALSSPILINKKRDKKWIEYVKDQHLNRDEYKNKRYPRFTEINNKSTIVASPVDEHFQRNGFTFNVSPEIQKKRETKMKRKSKRKSKLIKSEKDKKRITLDILEGLKLENQRTSLMIANTKRYSDGLKQEGVRSSMIINVDISANSENALSESSIKTENEDREIEVCYIDILSYIFEILLFYVLFYILLQESFKRMSARLSSNGFEPMEQNDEDIDDNDDDDMTYGIPQKRNSRKTFKVLQIDTDSKKLYKGDMILHGKDGSKKMVSLKIDADVLHIIDGYDIHFYPLSNVQTITFNDAEKYIESNEISVNSVSDVFTIHIEDGGEVKHIVLEAADQKERNLWFRRIMVKVCYITIFNV